MTIDSVLARVLEIDDEKPFISEKPQDHRVGHLHGDDGGDLLDELRATLTKYVVLPSQEAANAVVLWIAATHGLPAFEHATRLSVNSPVKRCGKSRLLEIIQSTAFGTVPTANISVPALFRMIDAASQPPTLILDEADRIFGSAKKDEENRDLIAHSQQRLP